MQKPPKIDWAKNQRQDGSLVMVSPPIGLDMLRSNHAGDLITRDGKMLYYGVIELRQNDFVFLTFEGMSNPDSIGLTFPPTNQTKIEALKSHIQILVNNGIAQVLRYEQIERVHF